MLKAIAAETRSCLQQISVVPLQILWSLQLNLFEEPAL